MTAAEKGELLDALLTEQPALRDRVEALAASRMSVGDRGAVAEEVELALRGLDIDELNGRAGYRRGVGYVEPGETADELLDEALQPFLDDLARRGTLGMTAAAAECVVGILDCLYRCRDGGAESLLEYARPRRRARIGVAPAWAHAGREISAVSGLGRVRVDSDYAYAYSALSAFWPESRRPPYCGRHNSGATLAAITLS